MIIPLLELFTNKKDYNLSKIEEEIAAKDVPEGKPFKIIDTADVPTDRTFRNAWEYQE